MLTTNNHPLFQLNMRRRGWWQNGRTPTRYAAEVIAWVVMGLLLAWVLLVGGRYALLLRAIANGGSGSTYQMVDDLWLVLLWCGGISLGLSYLLDFVLMAVTVGSINGERSAHRWQLIQLTPLSGQSVVAALHRANQFRLWRVAMIVVGTRIAVVMAFALMAFVLIPVLDGRNVLREMWNGFMYSPLENSYLLVLILAMTVFYIVEPLWRLRTTTALAMAVSAQVARYVVALAMAFPLMLGVWLVMIGMAGGMFWGTARLFDLMYDIVGYNISEYLGLIMVSGFVAAEIALFYYGFRLIERGALRWVLRHGFTLGERWQSPRQALPWWSWIRWWLPHSGIWRENPLFTVNLKGMRWWQDMSSPGRRFMWLLLWMTAGLLAVYVLVVLVVVIFGWHGAILENTLIVMGGAALVLLMWQDVRVTHATINSVHRGRVAPDNDLLRLTPLRPADMVQAYRAVVRTRTWNVTAVIAAHAIIVGLLYLLNVWVVWVVDRNGWTFSGWMWEFLDEEALLLVMTLAIVPPFVFMRVRVVTAVMMALALRLRGTLLHVAWALVLIGLLAAQTLVIVALIRWSYIEWAEFMAAVLLVTWVLAGAEWVALRLAQRFVQCSGH